MLSCLLTQSVFVFDHFLGELISVYLAIVNSELPPVDTCKAGPSSKPRLLTPPCKVLPGRSNRTCLRSRYPPPLHTWIPTYLPTRLCWTARLPHRTTKTYQREHCFGNPEKRIGLDKPVAFYSSESQSAFWVPLSPVTHFLCIFSRLSTELLSVKTQISVIQTYQLVTVPLHIVYKKFTRVTCRVWHCIVSCWQDTKTPPTHWWRPLKSLSHFPLCHTLSTSLSADLYIILLSTSNNGISLVIMNNAATLFPFRLW